MSDYKIRYSFRKSGIFDSGFFYFAMYTLSINSPIGYLDLISDKNALKAIVFIETLKAPSLFTPEILINTKKQLTEYFNGSRKEFELQLAPDGTDFQLKVWNEVLKIRFGETATYLDIAKLTGSPKNTRAVGLANGKNPIPIIIPCHRIIGSNGKLTGYSGGIKIKRWLLKHEFEKTPNRNLLF